MGRQGGEKEYYLASAAAEVFVAPTASFTLRGFKVAGTFLRGVLDNIGVEPELVGARIPLWLLWLQREPVQRHCGFFPSFRKSLERWRRLAEVHCSLNWGGYTVSGARGRCRCALVSTSRRATSCCGRT